MPTRFVPPTHCWVIGFLIMLSGYAAAQSFESGSEGSDGALVLTTPGTVVFDPRHFDPPLNPSGDNIFHFRYIEIAKGVTVRLSAKLLNGPVFWLSQGSIVIDGKIDLDGADGGRIPAIAGAGGYPGGAVGRAGYGPAEKLKSNVFLVPLFGGSGGDGGAAQGGGAGGGAILIASSTSITVNGDISANGGASSSGTGGGGGAIRLVAPLIDGTGSISASGGMPAGANGRVRFEMPESQFAGNVNETPFTQGKPFGLFLPPTPAASIRVVSMERLRAISKEFSPPQSEKITVSLETRNVAPGERLRLECFPESGPTVNFP